MELAFFNTGFHHDLNMRLATEFQGDERAQENQYRAAEAVHRSHEIPADSTRRPNEISQHLALAAQATHDAVRVWSVSSGALSWPQGLEALLGHPPSAATNDIGFWQKQLHPQDRARTAASIRDALASNTNHWTGEYRFRHSDGSFLDLLERAYIVRDSIGRPVQLVGSLMNITARRQLQDQLSRSQKMEAFGQLAGGVAHDFNNLLTTILGYSDLVVAEVEGRGTVAKYISEIRGAAGRAASLAQQLLAFSRKQPLEPRVLEVNALISNLERSILRLLGENISVFCELLPETKTAFIKIDPNQFTQIIVNLAVNARDAMSGGGTLTLRTSTFNISEASSQE